MCITDTVSDKLEFSDAGEHRVGDRREKGGKRKVAHHLIGCVMGKRSALTKMIRNGSEIKISLQAYTQEFFQ